MKKIHKIIPFSLLFLLPVFSSPGPAQNAPSWEWKPAAACGGPATWFAAAFTAGSKAYLCAGYGFGKALWEYDAGRDAWTRKTDFPGKERGSAVAFSIGNKGYVGLGFGDNDRFSDLWEYDPAADRWKQKASLPAVGRDHSGAFAIDGIAYVFGGTKGETAGNDDFVKEVWAYDPATDIWTRKADMPEGTAAPACFALNGKGYFGTGILTVVPYALSRVFWEYDPKPDRWTRKADFPGAARFKAVGFAFGGKGYIGTGIEEVGESSAKMAGDIWEYDPAANAWSPKPAFPGPARGASVGFVIGGRIYLGTGMDSGRKTLSDFWRT